MFDAEIYDAQIPSNSPYKFPIVKVQVSDNCKLLLKLLLN